MGALFVIAVTIFGTITPEEIVEEVDRGLRSRSPSKRLAGMRGKESFAKPFMLPLASCMRPPVGSRGR